MTVHEYHATRRRLHDQQRRARLLPWLTAALAAVTFVAGAHVGRHDERARWQDGTGLEAPTPVPVQP